MSAIPTLVIHCAIKSKIRNRSHIEIYANQRYKVSENLWAISFSQRSRLKVRIGLMQTCVS
jgi:hypothetical protein